MLKIGWFSTARGDSSRNLLNKTVERVKSGQLDAVIEFVFCSREPGEFEKTDLFIEQVKNYGIPLVCLSVKRFAARQQQGVAIKGEDLPAWRLEYDREVIKLLGDFKPDICVLAGYMLIMGSEMCNKYKIINLHPALPDGPKGTWQEVIWQLIDEKADRSGVMMHLVTPQLDRGPLISYCSYQITGPGFDEFWEEVENVPLASIKQRDSENNRLFVAIRKAGFMREIPLIIHTLKALSEQRICITKDKKLLDSEEKPIKGYDLTAEIDTEITPA